MSHYFRIEVLEAKGFPLVKGTFVHCTCHVDSHLYISETVPCGRSTMDMGFRFDVAVSASTLSKYRTHKTPLKITFCLSENSHQASVRKQETPEKVDPRKTLGFLLADLKSDVLVSESEHDEAVPKWYKLASSAHKRYDLTVPFQVLSSITLLPGNANASAVSDQTIKPSASKSHASTVPSITSAFSLSDIHEHKYRFAIDLLSVRDWAPKFANVFAYYQYPAFGSHSPVRTTPVEIHRGGVASLGHGFCSFEFVATFPVLHTVLSRQPLLIHIFHRDDVSKDELMGIASVPLVQVLDFEDKSCACDAVICAFEDVNGEETVRKVGVLSVRLSLKDLGRVKDDSTKHAQSPVALSPVQQSEATVAASHAPQELSRQPAHDISSFRQAQQEPLGSEVDVNDQSSHSLATSSPAPADTTQSLSSHPTEQRNTLAQSAEKLIRATPEYTAAYELELWKAEQKAQFLEALRRAEESRLADLDSKWAATEAAKRSQLSSLEASLKERCAALDKREQKISVLEADAKKKKAEAEAAITKAVNDCDERLRRIREESEHKLGLDRLRISELLKEKKELQAKLENKVALYDQLLDQFTSLKKDFYSSPQNTFEVKLLEAKSQIQKLEAKYKKYKKMYLDLQKAGAVAATADGADTVSASPAAPSSRLESLVGVLDEGLDAAENDKAELNALRDLASRLLAQPAAAATRTGSLSPSHADTGSGVVPSMQAKTPVARAEITSERHQTSSSTGTGVPSEARSRLLKEREDLLATGVYSLDDYIIRRLTAQLEGLESSATARR